MSTAGDPYSADRMVPISDAKPPGFLLNLDFLAARWFPSGSSSARQMKQNLRPIACLTRPDDMSSS